MERNSTSEHDSRKPPWSARAASAPAEVRRPDLEQLDELEARLEEERVRLRQLRETLVQDQSARGDGGMARRCARDVNRRIVEDEGGDNPPNLQHDKAECNGCRTSPQSDARAIDS